ncbi:MAG: hypothetical protein FWD93_03405 [Coriobacteriia bacterium]|nr:hypothetical protein [Coriobacteriia bacterium]
MDSIVKTKYFARHQKVALTVMGMLFVAFFTLALIPAKAFAVTSLTIPVEQIFSSVPSGASSGNIDYELTRLNSAYPLPAGTAGTVAGDVYRFTIAGNRSPAAQAHNLGPIVFSDTGIFTYTLRAVSPSEHGYTVDDRIYTITIAVSSAPGGGLQARIASIYYAGNGHKQERIIFEHSYLQVQEVPDPQPTDPDLMIDPPVVKTVQRNPARDYTFTFRLEAMQPGQPMPGPGAGLTGNFISTPQRYYVDISITGSGRAHFGVWQYTQEGVFVYTVREIPSNNRDYIFDPSVYTITDVVTNAGDQLVVERTITNQNNREVASLVFLNTYTGGTTGTQDTTPTITPPGGGTRPSVGPKTGDYVDPTHLLAAMAISAFIVMVALLLIYTDRKSEEMTAVLQKENTQVAL